MQAICLLVIQSSDKEYLNSLLDVNCFINDKHSRLVENQEKRNKHNLHGYQLDRIGSDEGIYEEEIPPMTQTPCSSHH